MLYMKFSNSYRWFYQVWWEQENRFIDCVVDLETQEGDQGCFVIADELGHFRIINSDALREFKGIYNVVGKAERYVCDL